METFSEKILGRIEEKKLAPKPRWRFLLKDYALWTAAVASALVGALAVMMIFVMAHVEDWDVVPYLQRSTIGHLLLSVSYLWGAILILLIFFVRLNFLHTRRGYRYPTYLLVSGSMLTSVFLGSGFYWLGVGAGWDDYLSERVPLYERLVYSKNDIWIYPELGLLGGQIQALDDGRGVVLTDLKGGTWYVRFAPDTVVEGRLTSATGTKIKIIGVKGEENEFAAKIVRSW